MKKLTLEEFINRANDIHGVGKYGYAKVKFNTCKDYITISCYIHGEFIQKVEAHYSGKGCKQCGIIKQKETLMKNYGVDNPFKSKKIQKDIQLSMIEKYGGKTAMESPILKDKIEQTNLQRYGVINTFQNKELMADSLENRDYSEISKKTKKTTLKRYGVTCVLASDDCQEKMLSDKRNRILDGIFLGNRLKNKITPLFTRNEYIDVATIYNWKCNICNTDFQGNLDNGKVPNCPMCYPPITSIGETDFLNFLKISIRNYRLPEWKTKPIDGYDDKNRIVYEFLGDYWHGNPVKFKRDDINRTTQDTFGKLYDDTYKHFNRLTSFGYIVKYIWENDWKKFKKGEIKDLPLKRFTLTHPI